MIVQVSVAICQLDCCLRFAEIEVERIVLLTPSKIKMHYPHSNSAACVRITEIVRDLMEGTKRHSGGKFRGTRGDCFFVWIRKNRKFR